MTTWSVVGTGEETGNEYVYRVTAPEGTSEYEVWNAACRAHGQKHNEGAVDEFLHPVPVSVTAR